MNPTPTCESGPHGGRPWPDMFDAGKDVLEWILSGLPLDQVLGNIARRIGELSSDEALCSISLCQADGRHLSLAAAAGLPEWFTRAAATIPIGRGTGSCGSAAALGENVVVEDITSHPDWASARELVLEHGLKACWSVPIFSAEGKVLGTLAIYHRTHRLPRPEELVRVESMAKLAGLAIERVRAAEKLRESETLLRIAGQNARLGGWTVDFPEGRITWSDEVCALHEMPKGHVPGIDEAMEFYPPESRAAIRGAFDRCVADGIPFDEELPFLTAGGRRLWVRSIGEAVRREDGTVQRLQGAFQDITARKEAEQAVRQLAARLTSTLESITDALFTLGPDWRFTYLNPEAERLLRNPQGEVLGREMWEVFPDLAGTSLQKDYQRAMAERRTVSIEDYYYEPWDQWFEIRIYPTEDGLAVYFRDVTASRRSGEQLRLLEACVARINDIVIITEARLLDEPGPRIVFVNDAFTKATGYSRDEALGRSPRFLQGHKTQRAELDRIRLALKKGVAVRAELINETKDGRDIWLEIDIVPVAGPAGTVTHFMAVERDITGRKRTEEEFRAGEERYIRQRNSLIALTGIQPLEKEDVVAAFRRITEAHARALGVARVGIWRYNADRTAIHCEDLYELSENRHSKGMILAESSYPAYFRALEEMDVIAVDDAHRDPRTCEFSSTYLHPLGITSMIDAPVMLNGTIDGVLCSEHVGPPRRWTGDEKTFVAAVANMVSLALEAGDRRRAENAVLEIQKRFEIVARATNDAVWDWDLVADEIWWNEGFETLFGFRRAEIEPSAESWYGRIHPEDAGRVLPGIRKILAGNGETWADDYRFQRADGTYAYVLDRGFVVRDTEGRAVRMVGGMTDLTARRQAEQDLARLNRALTMLSACNEALIRANDEPGLLTEICRLAVDTGGYRMAWVGYARDDARRTIEPIAWAGEESGYLSEIQLSWDEQSPTGKGPAGRTIRGGGPVVCGDIIVDSAFFHWLDAARRRGYRSVICLPLRDGERVFGLLGLYSSEVQHFVKDEVKLLQELADNLAFGIGNIRARIEHQRTQEVVLKVAQAVSSGTGSEFFDLLTANMVEALQAHGGLIGRFNADDLSVSTLSYVLEGKRMDNLTYGLAGTPCENVTEGNVCVFERGVQESFPEDHLLVALGIHAYAGIPLSHREGGVAGIMVVFFSAPMQDPELVHSTLQIFATRAAAELDRQVADARILEQASLLDKARDAILVRDLDHRVTYWNKGAERLYGWSAEEAAGRSVEEFLYGDATDYWAAYDTVLACGEWVGEIQQFDRAGREITIEGRWTLLHDAAGEPTSILAINTDITEHEALKQQFLRAQRLESIGTLAGGIAHDLNNVLAPISMAIELLRSDVTSERGRELLATLAGSAKRGADMVNQVLSFARGVEGRRVEVHAGQLIDDVGRIVRDTFPKEISIAVRLPGDLLTIQGDPTQLHQVLLNLCVNARDAMPGGGLISIAADNIDLDARQTAAEPAAKPGPHVRIQVEDGGSGISPAHLDKIFEPFFTTKEVGKGTGLGLPTSMAIVKSHGGFIHAESRIGHGTRFDVYLPALPRSSQTAAGLESAELPRGNGETVLVADDEAPIRQVIGEILESFGYRVILAADGAEAVDLYRRNQGRISAVITDMMMPGMDGAATIRALSEIDPAVRIIAASGVASHEARAREAGRGVRHFVTKPCNAETLLKVLKRIISEER